MTAAVLPFGRPGTVEFAVVVRFDIVVWVSSGLLAGRIVVHRRTPVLWRRKRRHTILHDCDVPF